MQWPFVVKIQIFQLNSQILIELKILQLVPITLQDGEIGRAVQYVGTYYLLNMYTYLLNYSFKI